MAYTITDECISCGQCEPVCPVDVISEGSAKYDIEADGCIDCGQCASTCPVDAIEA